MQKTETTSRQRIMEMIEKLEDLKKQATVERSHFYVNNTATQAITMLYAILGEHYVE